MKYAAKTITGIRKQNQDAVFIPERGMIAIAAVADGMGGHNAGDIASALAIKTLVENMHKNAPGTIRERLINAVNMANSAVYELSFSDEGYRGMGTTLVAAVLEEKRFIAANVGDSRLYHYDGLHLKQITEDHSYVAQLAALGYITREEAARHPQRNIITRAVGTRPIERVDVFECAWEKGDKLLICTDGLYGELSEDELADALGRSAEELQTACDALVERAGLAADGLEGQSRGDLGELVQALGVVHVQARHASEHRGAVEQRQAVFGLELELDGGNAGLFQRFLCGHALALIEGLGLGHADENGDDVSHGGKVAAGAHAALPGHDGMHTLVEQLDKALNDDRTQAGNAAAEGVQADTHGRTDYFLGSRITDTAAVGQNGTILMQITLFDCDLVIFVLAKARVKAVNGGRIIAHPFTLHVVADFGDMCHAVLVDLDLITVAGNIDNVFDFQIHAVKDHFVH